jgi:hypothetical protein
MSVVSQRSFASTTLRVGRVGLTTPTFNLQSLSPQSTHFNQVRAFGAASHKHQHEEDPHPDYNSVLSTEAFKWAAAFIVTGTIIGAFAFRDNKNEIVSFKLFIFYHLFIDVLPNFL